MVDPPVIRRLRIVMRQLNNFTQRSKAENDDERVSRYARYSWVMTAMFEEVLDELAETDAEIVGHWFEQFGKVIEWCGSGDPSVLPESMRQYLAEEQPELLAITAGNS